MCGIAGVFDRSGDRVDPRLVIGMRDAIQHRGPDGEGLWLRPDVGDVALGHRRLAIIDLSAAGKQPMSNEDGTVQVTFNGEIYNHGRLRSDLERTGHVFRSRCDTEVLVHLYEERGEAMVEELIGMFAFALWDERRQRLMVARDRMGIKPVYWLDDGRRFAFASEIKALLPIMLRREIDPVALSHYLTFVAVPPPRTLFQGVAKLPAATTLLVDRSGPSEPERYWDALEHRALVEDGEIDWESEVMSRLEQSIDRRMMSDVPVGVFLSGGVDSSTNVALMSRLIEEPVNTFSVGFKDAEDFNEFGWARRVANRFKTNHHEVVIDHDDLWQFLPDLVFHQDEPIADPVCVPLYFVAKLAKDHGVTVVHVGEGADEIFAGYNNYLQAYGAAVKHWPLFQALPVPARRAIAAVGAAGLRFVPGREVHVEALRRGAQRDGRLWWGGAIAFYEDALQRVSTAELRRHLVDDPPRGIVARIAEDADVRGARNELDRLIYQDLRLRLPELLLMRVDKLTMANAVEARVPFLDHELVELAMSIPAEEKVRGGVGKHVLKRAVAGLLDEDLVWRPKQGFGAPVAQWFRGELGDRLERELLKGPLAELGYLRLDTIRDTLSLHRSGRADRSFQLWNVLNLSIWIDHWIAGHQPGSA